MDFLINSFPYVIAYLAQKSMVEILYFFATIVGICTILYSMLPYKKEK